MKKQFQFLFIFAAMILCCGNVFAGGSSTYYYNPVITSRGNGLVYITRQNAPAMSGYYYSGHYGTTSNPTNASSSSLSDYKLYAYPAHGYKFSSWEYDESLVTPKTQTGNGDQTTVKSNSTTKSSPTTTYIYANFAKDDNELQVVLQRPTIGSISVKSTYYNINASNQFEETTETVTSSTTDAEETRTLIHYSSDKLVLTASDASFSGWYKVNGDTKTLLSNESTYDVGTTFSSSVTIRAEFKIANFKVGSNTFENMADAISAASNGSDKTIVLLKDYTLTQNVTIPAGVTFLVPNDANYEVNTTAPKAEHSFKTTIAGDVKYDRSFVFRKLTLAEGVTLTINGSLNVGGFRWCASYIGNNGDYIPETAGNFRLDQGYGLIDMAANSMIILNNSASLCCWGRIRGEGTITANSGSVVRECWVNTDYRESDAYKIIAEDLDCFPMNQYYIQDIQVATTFKAGAQEILTAGMYIIKTDDPYTGPVNWIGTSNSFFELSGDAYITKRYDVATDRIIYDLYNGVTIHDAELNIMYQSMPYSFSTKNKIFDITNNCSINVHSGKTIIKTDLALAAGAELTIDSLAEVEVDEHVSLYVFDKDDWSDFACMKKIVPLFLPKYELSKTGANYYSINGIKVDTVFSGYASYGMLRTEENLTDAKIKVNGKLTIKGGSNNMDYQKKSGLYTTNAGAQIASDNSGLILFEQGIGTQTEVAQLWGAGRGDNDKAQQQMMVAVTPAQLMQGNNDLYPTASFTSNSTFKYFGTGKNGKWGKVSNVKFMDGDTELSSTDYAEGETITVPADTVKEGYAFKGWDNDYTGFMGNSDVVYTAQWESVQVEVLADLDIDTTVTITVPTQIEKVIVEPNGNLEINAATTITTLALSTTPSISVIPEQGNNYAGAAGQVTGSQKATIENAYIDIQMDPYGTLNASKYYAFAVPFKVEVNGGVRKLINDEEGDVMVMDGKNGNYLAYTYNGANRAANGKGSNWDVVTAEYFEPGVFYLVEFADASCNTFRFHMVEGGDVYNEKNINVTAYSGTKDSSNNGWNGIGNNAIQDASISTAEGVAQIFDPVNKTFTTIPLGNSTLFAMGTPLMVQVQTTDSAYSSAVEQNPSAPARMLAQPEDETLGNYTVRIKAEGATKTADQLFISASENAQSNYVIGKDLVKMFMGDATVAQLWVNDYGKKLSMNQAVLTDDVATASLTLYAPKAGEYTIYLKDVPEDATIYLLDDGAIVSNLNDGGYVVTLAKGENTQYSLRINARNTPGVVTSIEEALAGKDLQKVLLDGVVYIVRDGQLYNVLGQQR